MCRKYDIQQRFPSRFKPWTLQLWGMCCNHMAIRVLPARIFSLPINLKFFAYNCIIYTIAGNTVKSHTFVYYLDRKTYYYNVLYIVNIIIITVKLLV